MKITARRAAGAYVAATGSAVAICLGLQEAARRFSGGSARTAQLVRLTVPMLAVAISANVNLLLVRSDELYDGVEVMTDEGTVLGTSKVAARRALLECAATRVLWTFMLLTATPLCVSAASAIMPARLLAHQAARTTIELGVSFGIIWISVPLAIAVYPQRERVAVDELEPSVRQAARAAGCSSVYFNRGL